MSNRNLTGREIRDYLWNKEWRNFARPAVKIGSLGCLDGVDSAKAHANNNTNVFGLLGIDLEPAMLHRHVCGGDAILDKEIHFLDLFRLDKVFGVKIRHLPSDARCKSINIRESVDLPNTRPSGNQCLPIFFEPGSQRGN